MGSVEKRIIEQTRGAIACNWFAYFLLLLL